MIFKKLFSRIEAKSAPETSGLATPETWLIDLLGAAPLASGVTVNPRTAMQCTAVQCAVNAISQGIAQLPAHIYQRGTDGSRERAPDHPIASLLRYEVNEFTSSTTFIERLTADALLHRQGGIAEIIRIDGRPVELHRLDPETITIEADAYGAPLYKVSGPRQRILDFTDVMHLTAPTGCPTWHAREAIGLALTLEQHAARIFGNGAHPSSILYAKEKLPPDVQANIKKAIYEATAGRNSGKTLFLPGEVGFEQWMLSPVDTQFLELRKFAIEEIARVYRVPPILLMEYGRATFDNSEEMGRQFVTYALMPWIKRWEAEIRLKLLSADERDTYFAEFLTDDLLRADLEKRAEAYSKLIAARVLNPNEARALENRPPYAGGDEFANPNTTPGTAPANV